MYVFLDTNVYLDFFKYSKANLEELKKLEAAHDGAALSLIISQPLIDEFQRNRETVIAEALGRFRQFNLLNEFPAVVRETPQYQDLRDAVTKFGAAREIALTSLQEQIAEKALEADLLIARLWRIAEQAPTTDDAIAAARQRFDLGNPPGKRKDPLGDAINWELLLANVPDTDDLVIVSSDGDFASPLDPSQLGEFLANEWRSKKGGDILFYRDLSSFLKNRFPNIELAEDLWRSLLVDSFAGSYSFRTTHTVLNRLTYRGVAPEDFSDEEVVRLFEASISNDQIAGISTDKDVTRFFNDLHQNRGDLLDPTIEESFSYLYLGGALAD